MLFRSPSENPSVHLSHALRCAKRSDSPRASPDPHHPKRIPYRPFAMLRFYANHTMPDGCLASPCPTFLLNTRACPLVAPSDDPSRYLACRPLARRRMRPKATTEMPAPSAVATKRTTTHQPCGSPVCGRWISVWNQLEPPLPLAALAPSVAGRIACFSRS